MKQILLFVSFLISIHSIAQNTWAKKADFMGTQRVDAVAFSIGTKGYIGTGIDNDPLKDFWEYNSETNSWTQKADFGGAARYGASGFSIGDKGYVGVGFTTVVVKDFWEYDPIANTWTAKADYLGVARYHGVGLNIGGKGYIGTGQDAVFGYRRDFYEYTPATNSWLKKADFAGFGNAFGTGFTIGDKGYIGTGNDVRVGLPNEFWQYDQTMNSWNQETNFPVARTSAVGFSVGSKGYIGGGTDGTNELNSFYEFDPSTHVWTQVAAFGGSARDGAVAFSIGTKGYVSTGVALVGTGTDTWEYTPASPLLAVNLTNLRAYQKKDGVQIEWTVQQADNNDRYLVQRSNNGQLFTTIENVKANGNTNVSTYNFFDNNAIKGVSYYRLKIIDKSAVASYSAIVKININTGPMMISIYPNPLTGNSMALQLQNVDKGNYIITLNNEAGQQLLKKTIYHQGGSATETIGSPKSLSKGVYLLTVTGAVINVTRQVIKK